MDDEIFTPRAGHSATAVTLPNGTPALVAFGGYDGESVCDDSHVFVPAEGTWRPLGAEGEPPAPRAMHAAALLDGDMLVVHGGWAGDDVLRSDTCVLELLPGEQPFWDSPCSRLSIAPGPSARQGHTLVAVAPRMVLLFGGDVGGDVSAELWSLSAPRDETDELRWQSIAPSGAPPPARSGHVACALSRPADATGGRMLIFGGRVADGACLGDLFLFATDTCAWSQPRVEGDVPRARWAAACCALPDDGPHGGPRVLVDGGRDAASWVDTQVLIDVVSEDEPPSATGIALRCHLVRPGGHPPDEGEGERTLGGGAAPASSVCRAPLRSGHSATACDGSIWIVGGSSKEGRLSADTVQAVTRVVRWVCPTAGKEGIQFMAGRKGQGGPRLFKELVGPPLLASTHTATRCGEYFFVLGGHEPPTGLLSQRGGGLLLYRRCG